MGQTQSERRPGGSRQVVCQQTAWTPCSCPEPLPGCSAWQVRHRCQVGQPCKEGAAGRGFLEVAKLLRSPGVERAQGGGDELLLLAGISVVVFTCGGQPSSPNGAGWGASPRRPAGGSRRRGLVLEQRSPTLGFWTGSSLAHWVLPSVLTQLPWLLPASPSRLKGDRWCQHCSGLSGFTRRGLEAIPEFDFLSVWPLDQSQRVSIHWARLSYPNSRVVQNIQSSFPFILLIFLKFSAETTGSFTLIYEPPYSSCLWQTRMTCDFRGSRARGLARQACTASLGPLSMPHPSHSNKLG